MESMEKQNFQEASGKKWLTELSKVTQGTSSTKSRPLLIRRRIPQMLLFGGVSFGQGHGIYSSLIKLQDAIYPLDCYGEAVWQVSSHQLRCYWSNILRQLSYIGLGNSDRMDVCSEMLEYQDVELSLRRLVDPSTIAIDRFYFLKTSDVRLSRRLAAMLGARMTDKLLKVWEIYDALSEVIDDLEDQAEDTNTFNANRFLISCKKSSKSHVFLDYSNFINSLLGSPEVTAYCATDEAAKYVVAGIRNLGLYAFQLLRICLLTPRADNGPNEQGERGDPIPLSCLQENWIIHYFSCASAHETSVRARL